MRSSMCTLLLVVLVLTVSLGCNKSSKACHWAPEPYALIPFQLYKGGQLVTDSSFLASLKLYCYQNNQKKYVPIGGVINALSNDTSVFYKNRVMEVNLLSTLNIKNYYLEYPNNVWTTDTLYIDYLAPSPRTGCGYNLNAIKYNNTIPNTTTVYYQKVYMLNKP